MSREQGMIREYMGNRGYITIHTGGSCLAWWKEQVVDGEVRSIMVTDIGGTRLPERFKERVLVGIYNNDGQVMLYFELDSIVLLPERGEWQEVYDAWCNAPEEDEDV